jgi:hypothetical protein
MKIVTTQKYTTSDGKTFEDMKRAQSHEMTLFFSADLNEGDRLTAASIIDKMLLAPGKVTAKLDEITNVGAAEAV